SLVSIIETYISGLCDKFGITRGQAVVFGVGFAALVSFIYATQGGMYFLDAADCFINRFGVAALGLVEVVLVGWILRNIGGFNKHAEAISHTKLGSCSVISLGLMTQRISGYITSNILRVKAERSNKY